MKNAKLIGKSTGIYEGTPFFQLFFCEPIDAQNGSGVKPYQRQSVFNGNVRTSPSIACTETIYNLLVVDEVYDLDSFLFNNKGKLAGFDN